MGEKVIRNVVMSCCLVNFHSSQSCIQFPLGDRLSDLWKTRGGDGDGDGLLEVCRRMKSKGKPIFRW